MNFSICEDGSRIIVTTIIHYPNDEWNDIMARIVRVKRNNFLELVGKNSNYPVIQEDGKLEFYACDTLISGGIRMINQEIESYVDYIENAIKEVLKFQSLHEISYGETGNNPQQYK